MTGREPAPIPHRTLAVVLAGGEGRRMGGGKPRRRFGAVSLVAHAVSLARRWSPEVAVAVRSADQAVGEAEAPLILDDPAVEGPLAGLAAALAHAAETDAALLLTLPCDAPRLPADLLARLSQALAADGLVAVAASNGRLQPTCALWRPAAAARLPDYLASGRRSLHGFAEACGMAVADWTHDGDDPFANANTPEELAALQPRTG
jgi:molybdopterin-guanine dinucleotide biosynthesis protein A